jgi:hypothetical protein
VGLRVCWLLLLLAALLMLQLATTWLAAAAVRGELQMQQLPTSAAGRVARAARTALLQQQQVMAAMLHTCLPEKSLVGAGAGSSAGVRMSQGMVQGLGIRALRRLQHCLSPTTRS